MVFSLVFLIYWYIKRKLWTHENFLIQWAFPLVIALSLFPFMVFTNGSLGYRFFLIAPIFLFTYSVLLFPKCDEKVAGILSVVFMVLSLFSYRSYQPALHDPPNQVYELITDRLEKWYDPKQYPLVIVHKSLAEMVIYKSDFDALNWEPEASKVEDALRVTNGLAYYHFSKYLSDQELTDLKKLTTNYYGLPESLWRDYLNRVDESNDMELLARIVRHQNPMEILPAFLSKSKPQP